jgi:formylmethanofuran dehydrogenase subunit E
LEEASEQNQLRSVLENAVRLHGHLGPFLAIGVRMGKLAERLLKQDAKTRIKFQIAIKVPLQVPFSCTIDGIQATTNCTIGNQRLTVMNSQKEICAYFKVDDSNRKLNITVNPEVIEDLMKRMAEGFTNERLAEQITSMSEGQLFTAKRE